MMSLLGPLGAVELRHFFNGVNARRKFVRDAAATTPLNTDFVAKTDSVTEILFE